MKGLDAASTERPRVPFLDPGRVERYGLEVSRRLTAVLIALWVALLSALPRPQLTRAPQEFRWEGQREESALPAGRPQLAVRVCPLADDPLGPALPVDSARLPSRPDLLTPDWAPLVAPPQRVVDQREGIRRVGRCRQRIGDASDA